MKIGKRNIHLLMPAIVVVTLIAMFFVVVAFAHAATTACEKTVDTIKLLNGKYKEEILIEGDSIYGSKMQIWGNVETKTWSLTLSSSGLTCMIYNGTGLEVVIQGQAL